MPRYSAPNRSENDRGAGPDRPAPSGRESVGSVGGGDRNGADRVEPEVEPEVEFRAEVGWTDDPDPAEDVLATGELAEPDSDALADLPEPQGPSESAPGDDHGLVRRAQAGDAEAFEALVRRHEGRAFRVARNMVPSDEDARDLAQDAFLRVFKSLDRFDFQHEFTTWLYRIVTNLAIDHLRKRRPTMSTQGGRPGEEDEAELDLVDLDAEQPSRRMEASETAREVRDCIASLAPHFQAVLTLRELEGLACIEIAKIVGATHVTVRWRLHRGRKLFQEEWERRARLASGIGEDAVAPDANNRREQS